MKKLLEILVLGLLWCNVGFAKEIMEDDIVIANGVSCRQQIFDFSNQKAKHVSELLFKVFM